MALVESRRTSLLMRASAEGNASSRSQVGRGQSTAFGVRPQAGPAKRTGEENRGGYRLQSRQRSPTLCASWQQLKGGDPVSHCSVATLAVTWIADADAAA